MPRRRSTISISSMVRATAQAQRHYEAQRRKQLREQQRHYTESRVDEVDFDNEDLAEQIDVLQNLLSDALSTNYSSVFETLKQSYYAASHDDPIPTIESYLPPDLGLKRFLPGAKQRYDQDVASAEADYDADVEDHNRREAERSNAIAQVKQWQTELRSGLPDAVADYFAYILDQSEYPDDFPRETKIAFVPESKQLVVEQDLPTFDIVPDIGSYKYVKSRDEITTTQRPINQRKTLYSSVVAQITLRTLHEIFAADLDHNIENTVGVSAVRDLFGTVQNEGASKGILVTTSGYGKAAFDFAAGKPLELLSGSNLLYLLKENANIEARIEVPPDWKDPRPDIPEVV